MEMEKKRPPRGYKREKFIPRWVNGEAFPIPVPRGDPLYLHATMFFVSVNNKNK
jgi:hypothetical protein